MLWLEELESLLENDISPGFLKSGCQMLDIPKQLIKKPPFQKPLLKNIGILDKQAGCTRFTQHTQV